MQPNERDLSKYRLERAKEDIQTAQINIENGLYKGAAKGIFKKYATPNLIEKEKSAWVEAVREKHGNS